MPQHKHDRRRAALATPGQPRAWLPRFAALIVLALAGIAIYRNSFAGPFVYDDLPMIQMNPAVRDLGHWLFFLGGSSSSSDDRPIGFLTFALNYAWGGSDVRGYHLVNLAIHVTAAWVLFDLVRRTLLRPRLAADYGARAGILGLTVALIWLVHPLQTQSVTYIYQRLESLMALFYLATLWCFVRALDSPRPRAWYAASVVCCALGMGTKEVMVTAPLIVLWYDRVFVAETWRELFARRGQYYVAQAGTWGILAALMWAHASNYAEHGVLYVKGISPLQYALSEPGVILHYLRLAFWPDELCLDYRWPVARTAVEIVPPALALGGLLAVCAWAVYRWPAWGFVGGAFFLILAPTSSVAPIVDLAVEHRMYLPLAALVVLVVLVADRAWRAVVRRLAGAERLRSPWARLVPATLVLAAVAPLAWRTIRRNADYQSERAIWEDTLRQRPDNARAHTNLSRELDREGDLSAALDESNRAIRLDPNTAIFYNNRGDVYLKLGRPTAAREDFDKAIALGARSPEVYYNRGNALAALKLLDEAIDDYSRAIELFGDFAAAYHNRGVIYIRRDKFDPAIKDLTRAIQLQPDLADAYVNRSVAYQATGQTLKGIEDCDIAIRLNPLFGSAYARRATANFALHRHERAWSDARKAAQLGSPLSPQFLKTVQESLNSSRAKGS
jgi:tetratricopeptide (TPR) repeat protein